MKNSKKGYIVVLLYLKIRSVRKMDLTEMRFRIIVAMLETDEKLYQRLKVYFK